MKELTTFGVHLFRYKKELSQAADREASLDRSQAQLELDWQRRFEDVERNQYEKSEELIQKLTRNRDDVSFRIEFNVISVMSSSCTY